MQLLLELQALALLRLSRILRFLRELSLSFSLLAKVLKDIHASISVEVAPDRDAIVLRGHVPDISYANAAEATALKYVGI